MVTRRTFSFSYVDIQSDASKCKFIFNRMLIGFLPIFVADTKIIYGYNFAAPLK